MNKKNKTIKIVTILLISIMLCGCTKSLTDKNNKPIQNEKTGQTITKNIICRPNDKDLIKIYEDNKVNISKLPKCEDMKLIGKYEDLWNSFFVRPLAFIIIKVGELVKNTGLGLIIVTILIRLILYPLTKKTAMQSELIKQAQPELTKLEKKYEGKTDNDSLTKKSQEMMMIYKKYNINPMSGCLFSFIQLPLLFAFLEAINRVPAIFEGKFLAFKMGMTPLKAITSGSIYYIIICLAIIGTTYISFKMNSSSTPENNGQMKTMSIMMTIFIGAASFTYPTAIAIYWITSSLCTIGQNLITDRRKKHE